jgi:exosortase/archaeosortase family protein
MEVVDGCSGLRSLTTMIALSLALIDFSGLTLGRRWLDFLAAFPIAIFINIFRLTVTALMASKYGEEVAQGFLHDFSGWLAFILGLLIFFGIT